MPRTNGIRVFYLAIAQGICSWESENEFLANTMPQRLTSTLETGLSAKTQRGAMDSRVGRRKPSDNGIKGWQEKSEVVLLGH